MIDDHPTEIEAMRLFREGRGAEASKLQAQWVEQMLASGEDYCTCPSNCAYHGDCVRCIIVHRGHGDHLPHCMRAMVNRRIDVLSGLTEHSFEREARGEA